MAQWVVHKLQTPPRCRVPGASSCGRSHRHTRRMPGALPGAPHASTGIASTPGCVLRMIHCRSQKHRTIKQASSFSSSLKCMLVKEGWGRRSANLSAQPALRRCPGSCCVPPSFLPFASLKVPSCTSHWVISSLTTPGAEQTGSEKG